MLQVNQQTNTYKKNKYQVSVCCGKGGSMKEKRNKKTTKKTRNKKRRTWSKKYKDSINCKKPKGFSQRQHCIAKSKRATKSRGKL